MKKYFKKINLEDIGYNDFFNTHYKKTNDKILTPARIIAEHKEFNSALGLYIRQAVKITDEFTPGWFGKAQYEKNLNYASISRYAHVAFKKIISEIRWGIEGWAE